MRGVLDFKFDNIKEGNQIECSQFTLDNGKTWQPIEEIMNVIEN